VQGLLFLSLKATHGTKKMQGDNREQISEGMYNNEFSTAYLVANDLTLYIFGDP